MGLHLANEIQCCQMPFTGIILCIVNLSCVLGIIRIWAPGSDIYLYQETLSPSESCMRRIKRTSSFDPPEMATSSNISLVLHRLQVHLTAVPAVMSFALSPPFLSVPHIIGMPKWSCILKLRTDSCFVSSLLCRGTKAKLHRRKPNVYVALQEISETC